MTPDDLPLLAQRVVVSRRSHEQDLRPRFVYRQEPMSPSDSGWSVLVGDETPQELDDQDALISLTVGELVGRWPALRRVFETDATDSEWVWDDDRREYVPHIRPDGRR